MSLAIGKATACVITGTVIDKVYYGDSITEALTVGAVCGGSVLLEGTVSSFIPASLLSVFRSYADLMVSSVLSATIMMILRKYGSIEIASRGFLRDWLLSVAVIMSGSYLEQPLQQFLPTGLSR